MKPYKLSLFAFLFVMLFNSCTDNSVSENNVSGLSGSKYFGWDKKYHQPAAGLTMLNVDSYQQTTEYTCGPASVISLLRYYNRGGDEMTIASEMGTSTTTGTTPQQMTDWLNGHGFTASWHQNGTLDTLVNNLKRNKPVLVEWSDWGGHWVLLAGYDTRNTADLMDDVVIFADPYDRHDDNRDGFTWFNAQRFYYMWYDALLFGSLMKRVYILAEPVK
ncbi:MAG: C39 family peptidase [Bacteroidetes bacterium]|nr:C39 family peptidase [Bacteroidota bacterium]